MGREALIHVEAGKESGEAKALLESTELILRGDVKRKFAKSAIEKFRVSDDVLEFTCASERVKLHLGPKLAESWAAAIAKPPPDLKQKLGLDKGSARMIGARDDTELNAALKGAIAASGKEATMVVARVDSEIQLRKALAAHAKSPQLPLWVIYPKGKTDFGDSAIREQLRARGFRDTKSCAVSQKLTATRYNPA